MDVRFIDGTYELFRHFSAGGRPNLLSRAFIESGVRLSGVSVAFTRIEELRDV
jgi:hypothetical protein